MPTFSKQERLHEKSLIDLLFSQGRSFSASCAPVRIRGRFLFADSSLSCSQGSGETVGCKIMFSASKRHFKRAVVRNRIKRLMRESFRCQKEIFCRDVPPGKVLLLFIQYTGPAKVSFQELFALTGQLPGLIQKRVRNA